MKKNCVMQSFALISPSTTVPNDLFCSNDKVDNTSPASNADHISDDIENTKDEVTNDADTKDEDNCLD